MERAEVICFWLAFLAYAAALVFFVYYFFTRRERQNRVGIALAIVGFAFQVAVIALRDIRTGHMPVVGAYESLLTISWALMVVYLLLEWRTRIKALGLYIMPHRARLPRRSRGPTTRRRPTCSRPWRATS